MIGEAAGEYPAMRFLSLVPPPASGGEERHMADSRGSGCTAATPAM
ncbi:hypothetical protein HMPREF0239_00991 [Clostridium sp. ATCC BAA-442]|nr:hypothetical protein HMPREF0239_00991 [Clostridium sp. ATCC BAA-442]